MGYRERIDQLSRRMWECHLSTHLGTNIPNETGDHDLTPSHQTNLREQRFDHLFPGRRRRPAIHGYNCFGQVFAERRTGLFDDFDLETILLEDGFGEIESEDRAEVGDVVVYSEGGTPVHVARIVRIEDLLVGASSRRAHVVSKFNSTSGEFEHAANDLRWAGDQQQSAIRIRFYRDRLQVPRPKPGSAWRAKIG